MSERDPHSRRSAPLNVESDISLWGKRCSLLFSATHFQHCAQYAQNLRSSVPLFPPAMFATFGICEVEDGMMAEKVMFACRWPSIRTWRVDGAEGTAECLLRFHCLSRWVYLTHDINHSNHRTFANITSVAMVRRTGEWLSSFRWSAKSNQLE